MSEEIFDITIQAVMGLKNGEMRIRNGRQVVLNLLGALSRFPARRCADRLVFCGDMDTLLGKRACTGQLLIQGNTVSGELFLRGTVIPLAGKKRETAKKEGGEPYD